MAVEIKHVSHECALTSAKIVSYGICNICYKDEPIELSCDPCNFDLCKTCSKLPQKVYHDFHPDHSLEFHLHQNDQTPSHIICSGCGMMSSGSFYKCKDCEIYLDLSCAVLENIFRSWDAKQLLHNHHAHLLKRCRPGLDATGSCLLCELPLSPSAICYGCVRCYLFFHERCLDLPTEIQHPLHPLHLLKRFDYIQNCGEGRYCDACGDGIYSVPFGCLECGFKLHMRCADKLLRGLMHPSHEHRLFYANTPGSYRLGKDFQSSCSLCNEYCKIPFFYCLQCGLRFHLKCLEIPNSVVDKSIHIHPLVCRVLPEEDDSLEYCGVCETMVHARYHVYSCEQCDYLGHIECVLSKGGRATHFPLYLKDLYSCGQTVRDDCKTTHLENKLMVKGIGHTHVLGLVDLSELDESAKCKICNREIYGNACKCETCRFQTHDFCAELELPRRHRFHLNHPLTLLPYSPIAGVSMNCDHCRKQIAGFNLFCRLCGFVIHVLCVLNDNQFLGTLQRGQKMIAETKEEHCLVNHSLYEVIVSKSYPVSCSICEESPGGKSLSCVKCREIYHSWCIKDVKRGGIKLRMHPLHPQHKLWFSDVSGSKCILCKLNITKYGYGCHKCPVSFHFKCVKAVGLSKTFKYHIRHYLYNFWEDTTLVCSVCARRCGPSFYGCIECRFSAHVECVGFPKYVKNQRHQHTVEITYSTSGKSCSLCGSKCHATVYSCGHCKEEFHTQCIMSTDGLNAASAEDQLRDIYLMYIEQDLLDIYPKW